MAVGAADDNSLAVPPVALRSGLTAQKDVAAVFGRILDSQGVHRRRMTRVIDAVADVVVLEMPRRHRPQTLRRPVLAGSDGVAAVDAVERSGLRVRLHDVDDNAAAHPAFDNGGIPLVDRRGDGEAIRVGLPLVEHCVNHRILLFLY